MKVTRRNFLRDAGSASLAVACSGLPLLSRAQCSSLDPGIRVILVGTWLFCADPSGSGMLAIAVEMDVTKQKHKFPHGAWPGDTVPGGINNGTMLNPNPSSSGQPDRGYAVTIQGYTPAKTIQELFSDSACRYGFNFIENPTASPWKPDFSNHDIRVISLPVPTAILPGNLLTKSTLTSYDGNHQFHNAGGTCVSGKPASAHVFTYDGASSLTFLGKRVSGGTDYKSNYHFHTVPDCPDPSNCPPHGAQMFAALIEKVLKQQGKVTVTSTDPDEVPQHGGSIPPCITSKELDVPDDVPSQARKARSLAATPGMAPKPAIMPHRTTASCAGASVGLGGS